MKMVILRILKGLHSLPRGGKFKAPLATLTSPKKIFHGVSKLARRGGARGTLAGELGTTEEHR